MRDSCQSIAADTPAWRSLLEQAVAVTSVTAVAQQLGVARSSLSLLINGKYPGGTTNMAKRIMDVLAEPCPVYAAPRSAEACAARRAIPMPTSNPYALRKWRACQHCNLWSEK